MECAESLNGIEQVVRAALHAVIFQRSCNGSDRASVSWKYGKDKEHRRYNYLQTKVSLYFLDAERCYQEVKISVVQQKP